MRKNLENDKGRDEDESEVMHGPKPNTSHRGEVIFAKAARGLDHPGSLFRAKDHFSTLTGFFNSIGQKRTAQALRRISTLPLPAQPVDATLCLKRMSWSFCL